MACNTLGAPNMYDNTLDRVVEQMPMNTTGKDVVPWTTVSMINMSLFNVPRSTVAARTKHTLPYVTKANTKADNVPTAMLSRGVFNSPLKLAPAMTPVNPGNNTVNIKKGEFLG